MAFLGILLVIFPLLDRLKRHWLQRFKILSIELSTQTIEYLQAMRLVRLYGRTDFVLKLYSRKLFGKQFD